MDRDVGLKELGEIEGTAAHAGRMAGADMAHGQRVAKAIGRSDHDHLLADPNRVRIAHLGDHRAFGHPLEPQQRQIGRRLGGHDLGADLRSVGELHLHDIGDLHQMSRGQDIAIPRYQHARTQVRDRHQGDAVAGDHHPLPSPHEDHRSIDCLEQVLDLRRRRLRPPG